MRMDYWGMSHKLHLCFGTEKRDDNRKTSVWQGSNEMEGGQNGVMKEVRGIEGWGSRVQRSGQG